MLGIRNLLLGCATLLSLLPSSSVVNAFDYAIDDSGLGYYLVDVKTGIDGLESLHTGDLVSVTVTGVAWSEVENATSSDSILTYSTFVDGVLQAEGTIDLNEGGRQLPTEFAVGEITADSSGRRTISTILELDEVSTSVENSYMAFTAGSSIVPLIIILLFAATTANVELSLGFGILVGACMVTGSLEDGFFRTLDQFILGAVADGGHAYVYLFTFFLSGVVGMMEKSGGFAGFTAFMSKYATSSRAGQMVAYVSGLAIFFDDYANTLIVGESLRPLTDLLNVSREKLAFIVDATSAPIASITPISAWIGFEIGLIQDELDKILKNNDPSDVDIQTNALAVFTESIKFRYYPFFMLLLMPTIIILRREFGPMLVAERKAQIFARGDGGDGKGTSAPSSHKPNRPADNTPPRLWNMAIPICLLVALMIHLLIFSGTDGSEGQTLLNKFEQSDSYSALLWASMAAGLLSLFFYHLQFKQYGDVVLLPTPTVLTKWFNGSVLNRSTGEDETEPKITPLLSVNESFGSFLYGMGHVFPAAIVLTLAWASGSIMGAVGTDRLFAAIISESIAPESLPTLSFAISFLMALATGTSWGTMAIVFPLMLVPSFDASGGDPSIFYATIAGILSGSVAGDHVSPISDTTVLSSLATDCDVLKHVVTQSPYVFIICLFSIFFGTLPVGYEAYPNGVAYLLGYGLILLFSIFVCRPVISKTGSFDVFTELYLRFNKDSPIHELKALTVKAYSEGVTVAPAQEQAPEPVKAMVEELTSDEAGLDDTDKLSDDDKLSDEDAEAADGDVADEQTEFELMA